ncbi:MULTISPECIES: AMP-binding protein [unclassified Neisseria]|uniref:AMP-binding protein n=1 Tax=unclassified Neisseria TaxID=2623750 RepID=UPI002666196F|nr:MULTISPECIES: AMP-binding protein [unclassified Neisseria]MDO1509338.1 AMP-binding protein [Neisseria sp. MVDL19-042950]MDO1515383.1 AMP-binding protein [Neisseria sp. MVDL18-041461]MDO1562743.1 AMP-binding protein [Neisseria sp. MVDL20-010259]
MNNLTQILSPTLPQTTLIATNPDWIRADFNHAVLYLSGRLKEQNVQTAALWFEDAALFACAVLAAWHAGVKVLLLPNLAQENAEWGGFADVWLTDAPHEKAFSDGLHANKVYDIPAVLSDMPSEIDLPENRQIPENAEAYLKTSGSTGGAQIIVKTAAQMQAEALALVDVVPFTQEEAVVVGSVSPQHLYGFTFRFALPLTMGWTMERQQNVYPETLLAATSAHRRVVWIASPALLNRLGEARNWQAVGHKIAGIVSAGGALPKSTADLLAQHAVMPFEIYGSTETGVIAYRRHQKPWQPFGSVSIGQDNDGALWAESPWTAGRQQTADVIEPQNDGFILLGRKDRIIKFEDKRVSLTRIEHDLLAHKWIADAHCGLHPQHKRLAVWAALNSDGIQALREQGRAAVSAALKKHLAVTQDTIALPRYWRFAASLPRNAQSKITTVDFQTAFTEALTAPEWQQRPSENDGAYRFNACVPLDLSYFGGHFANFPLVPGVVELQWVRDLAERFEWGRSSIIRVENLKYQQFLRPNDEVSAELKYDAEKSKLTFKLENQEAVCASGRIVFGAFEAV